MLPCSKLKIALHVWCSGKRDKWRQACNDFIKTLTRPFRNFRLQHCRTWELRSAYDANVCITPGMITYTYQSMWTTLSLSGFGHSTSRVKPHYIYMWKDVGVGEGRHTKLVIIIVLLVTDNSCPTSLMTWDV